MFIAYTTRCYKNSRNLIESAAHSTREEAARELFGKMPKLKSCSTAVAVNTVEGYKTYGADIRSISRRELPAPKATKAEVLALMSKLYRILNTADHETKAEWMTYDLAGENGCACLDKIMQSKAFTADERQEFLDNL